MNDDNIILNQHMNTYSYVHMAMKKESDIMSQKHNDICDVHHTHPETINIAKFEIPSQDDISVLSDTFKILSDDTRIKIICALVNNELCVCDICEVVGLGQSAISHQLRVLRAANLVKYRRDGKLVYYSLDDHHVLNCITQIMEHIHE